MYTSIVTFALLSTALAAPQQEKRQATNGEQFTAGANALISQYLPASVLPELISKVSDAAAAASVTGDIGVLINSALLDQGLPDWFKTAVPEAWSSNIQALESGIDAIRGTVGLEPFVVAVPTTDASGATITNQVTTYVPASLTSDISQAVTTVVDGVTSVFTTAYNGGSSIASVIIGGGSSVVSEISSGGSSVVSEITSGGSSVLGEITSGASSVFSEATSGASSVASEITGGVGGIIGGVSSAVNPTPTTTTAAGAAPAVTAAAGGVLGLIGLMIML